MEGKEPANPEERDGRKREETCRGSGVGHRSGEEVQKEARGEGRQNERTHEEMQEEDHGENWRRPVHRKVNPPPSDQRSWGP
ncbi:hypothetical protein NDU88_005894 [Pleurodeles waltl]|uniref:Uncharacterized protein n=1 Tax=Pleurodeles waltl TaxID=8319 RepID=A0AAV7TW57_PLEWA|nr:hypothetical protein NDU88_005894 [Pleurodeles waltl]